MSPELNRILAALDYRIKRLEYLALIIQSQTIMNLNICVNADCRTEGNPDHPHWQKNPKVNWKVPIIYSDKERYNDASNAIQANVRGNNDKERQGGRQS